jgi:hypothetical protein
MGCFRRSDLWLSALGANAENIDIVAWTGETVLAGHLIGPFFKLLGLNFKG